jgi:hypothetical protein
MDIPVFFKDLLDKDTKLRGPVLTSIDNFEKWLKQGKLIFFPEYTDHGITHVERVLRSAEWLLADETKRILSSKDAAVLLLAVVLHDCAMHLGKPGFLKIVKRQPMWPPKKSKFLSKMNDIPWSDLWECFMREAHRWDGQKRVALFGNNAKQIRRPPEDIDAIWDDQDYPLIGEFLRRHHTRLAYEIAICGVPGADEDRLAFTELDNSIIDMAGLVARSHGMDLRSVVDLFQRVDQQVYSNIHVPLLMCLLRIADYLDIECSRAPVVLLKIHNLKSSISHVEWDKHSAILDTKIHPDDPETICIDVQPKSLDIFVGLQDLFTAIQGNIDASWAVLGEVYGNCYKRDEPSCKMRIRRIRSTLDDLDAFIQNEDVDFVPVRARFDTAGGDLLKLMVGPLYNDDPAYGVRELIQNAVDACRELKDVLDQNPRPDLERPEIEADVVVTVHEEQEGQGWITVEDRGIGMNPEVIVNYYLKAGASFRQSEAWHERHVDPDGSIRVARAGRFGLGVLATFLLGDEAVVETRHMEDPSDKGIKFIAKLDDPLIELKWCTRPVGTKITIRVRNPKVFDSLARAESWDWYRLEEPSVKRYVHLTKKYEGYGKDIPPGQMIKLEHGEIVPHGANPLPAPWRRLQRADFSEVLWCQHHEFGWADVVNGIILKRPEIVRDTKQVLWPNDGGVDWREDEFGIIFQPELFLNRPRIAVVEGEQQLTIDVKRTNTVGNLPFQEDLVDAICRDILASLLVRVKERREDVLSQIPHRRYPKAESFLSFATLWHPAVFSYSKYNTANSARPPGLSSRTYSWLFATETGVTLEDPSLGGKNTRLGVAFIVIEEDPIYPMTFPAIRISVDQDKDMLTRLLRRIPDGFPVGLQTALGLYHELESHRRSRNYACAVLIVPTKRWLTVRNSHGYQGLQQSDNGNGWTIAWTGDNPSSLINIEELIQEQPKESEPALVFFLLPKDYEANEPRNPLSRLWKDLFYHGEIPYGEIPYDRALRKQVLAHAYDKLKEDIELWEKIKSANPDDKPVCASYWLKISKSDENKRQAPRVPLSRPNIDFQI